MSLRQNNGMAADRGAESSMQTSGGGPLPWSLWRRQAAAVFRIEIKKNFSSGRRLWIYLLAFAPVLIIAIHSLDLSHRRQAHIQFVKRSAKAVTRRDLLGIRNGMTSAEVIERLGQPHINVSRYVPAPPPQARSEAASRQAMPGQPADPHPAPQTAGATLQTMPVIGIHPVPPQAPAEPVAPAEPGAPGEASLQQGQPRVHGSQPAAGSRERTFRGPPNMVLRQQYRYATADEDFFVIVEDGKVVVTAFEPLPTESLEEDTSVFAEIFQIYYVRLGIFFGCMGIFTWLFRGEMVERHLHYYFLAPMRREVLVVGKFAAGAFSAIIVFCAGVLFSFAFLYSSFGAAGRAYIFSGPGLGQLGSYLAITVLACLGYGATALALSLLFKNIAVPGLILLGWETINSALPPLLQKLSVTHYLKQLVPVQVPPHGLLALFTVVTEPVPPAIAAAGLLALTTTVLILACLYIPRLEINYATD